jgi:hypothetical protein
MKVVEKIDENNVVLEDGTLLFSEKENGVLSCKGCYFDSNTCPEDRGGLAGCTNWFRGDGASIIWVKRETTMKQTNVTNNHLPLMSYNPADGTSMPYPSEASQFREYHGKVAWLFNPYTGDQRNARDVGSDVFGLAISQ